MYIDWLFFWWWLWYLLTCLYVHLSCPVLTYTSIFQKEGLAYIIGYKPYGVCRYLVESILAIHMYSPLTEKTEPMPAEIGWRGSIISVKGLYMYPGCISWVDLRRIRPRLSARSCIGVMCEILTKCDRIWADFKYSQIICFVRVMHHESSSLEIPKPPPLATC
jgi:hypothetical protein